VEEVLDNKGEIEVDDVHVNDNLLDAGKTFNFALDE